MQDLYDTLYQFGRTGRFKEIVLFVNACYSETMTKRLQDASGIGKAPKNNIYFVTLMVIRFLLCH